MGKANCTPSAGDGRVRHMNITALFYSFVAMVASCFAVASPALADSNKGDTSLTGFVFASNPCDLHPPVAGEACVSVLVPISGTISLRAKGAADRREIALSKSGSFTQRVKAGRYTVRLLKPSVGGEVLNRRDYRISPSQITVSAASNKSGTSGYFAVSHRSRPASPFAGVSDGCEIAK